MTKYKNISEVADRAIAELKEKQLWGFALLLLLVTSLPNGFFFYRVLILGVGNPLELIYPLLNEFLFLLALAPARWIPFGVKRVLVLIAVMLPAIVPLVLAGTVGSGYLVAVFSVFYVHHFFHKRAAMILTGLIVFLCGIATTVGIHTHYDGLVTLTLKELYGYTTSKILITICVIVTFQWLTVQTNAHLKRTIIEAVSSRETLKQEQLSTNEYLESIPGIFVLFNENWEIVRWNQNLERMTGYSTEALQGKPLLSFFKPEQESQLRKSISELFFKGSAYVEGEVLRKDGTGIPFAFTSKTISRDDEQQGCIIGIDISERKTLEQEVQQAQKMEALGVLAGGVAHDLNNVLAGIIGYTDIIRSKVELGETPPLEHVDVVLNSSMRATGIVRQILMFARRGEEKRMPVALRSVVRDAVELIRHTIPKSIDIKANLSGEKYMVVADANHVHQVVMNICTNAWHAMRETGGMMEVSLDVAEVRGEQIPDQYHATPGLYQKLRISDTGTGIPKEIIKKVFDPFFTTKDVGEGTGLGLAVVDKIIRSHNGFLVLESEMGKGTTFSMYFPVFNPNDSLKQEIAADTELPRGIEGILVVDDEPAIRESMEIILKELGYHVITAENGELGLAAYRENKEKIRLVITDLSMPRMNGSRMALEICADNSTLPILLCTGYSEAIESKNLRQDQFSALIHKPVRREKLARAVRALLDGKPVASTDDPFDM